MTLRRTGLAATLFALALSAILTAPAGAEDSNTAIAGNPLTVHIGQRGQLQAFRAGSDSGIFFAPHDQLGDAGFFLAFPAGLPGASTPSVYGFSGSAGPFGLNDYTTGTQSPPTGSGSASDPYRQTTTYSVTNVLKVTQTTEYVNGTQQFHVSWKVENTSTATVSFKALAAADFYFDGSDRGTGIYTNGPPRFIGGTNADTGNSGGFAEDTSSGSPTWSAYQALEFGSDDAQVWGKVQNAAASAAASFDNSVVGQPVDNAGGVEWDGNSLAPGATRTFELRARSAVPSALQLTPPNGGAPKGVPINFTATATNTDGVPYAGKTLRYSITGANAASGSATLSGSGTATITDPGTNAGADTVVAYVDFNNDGTRQPVEPQASALGTFVDNVAPSCKVKVTGDRPGGGGAGKPLVISVNCNEAATVTATTVLRTIPTARPSAAGASARKRKPVTIRLKTATAAVSPGQAFRLKVAISKKIRKKYAGKTLKATTKVSARDAAGNVKTVTATRKVKLAKLKKATRKH